MKHGKRSNGKAHGVVNTKTSVVAKMLDLVKYTSEKDLSTLKILEPSAGTGAFAQEIIKRLYDSSLKFGFDFNKALDNIYLCEIDQQISDELIQSTSLQLKNYGYGGLRNIFINDFLLLDLNVKFDLVVGNPPYVRHENIPSEIKAIYQNKFATFVHRSDLYIPFYEKALKHLNANGKLIYVCSNRWLKNSYGQKLRELISSNFHLETIIDLEKADIFQEEVLGYPAITIVVNKRGNKADHTEISDLESFLDFNPNNNLGTQLNLSTHNWFTYNFRGHKFERNLSKIEDQGYKIGIGVATGRDSIFISDKFEGHIEKTLLLPILTSKDVKGNEINWSRKFIINPFDNHGELIDLGHYPKAKKYFEHNKSELSSRHVAKKNPLKYYKTIDKIYKCIVAKPKVILPDISGDRFINVDKGEYYPHHNLYYVLCNSYEEATLLACVLMSDFTYDQLIHIGNKMKGGYPRWQSQNLRKLHIPVIKSMPLDIKSELLNSYKKKDLIRINELITPSNIERFEQKEGQAVLFEPTTPYK